MKKSISLNVEDNKAVLRVTNNSGEPVAVVYIMIDGNIHPDSWLKRWT